MTTYLTSFTLTSAGSNCGGVTTTLNANIGFSPNVGCTIYTATYSSLLSLSLSLTTNPPTLTITAGCAGYSVQETATYRKSDGLNNCPLGTFTLTSQSNVGSTWPSSLYCRSYALEMAQSGFPSTVTLSWPSSDVFTGCDSGCVCSIDSSFTLYYPSGEVQRVRWFGNFTSFPSDTLHSGLAIVEFDCGNEGPILIRRFPRDGGCGSFGTTDPNGAVWGTTAYFCNNVSPCDMFTSGVNPPITLTY